VHPSEKSQTTLLQVFSWPIPLPPRGPLSSRSAQSFENTRDTCLRHVFAGESDVAQSSLGLARRARARALLAPIPVTGALRWWRGGSRGLNFPLGPRIPSATDRDPEGLRERMATEERASNNLAGFEASDAGTGESRPAGSPARKGLRDSAIAASWFGPAAHVGEHWPKIADGTSGRLRTKPSAREFKEDIVYLESAARHGPCPRHARPCRLRATRYKPGRRPFSARRFPKSRVHHRRCVAEKRPFVNPRAEGSRPLRLRLCESW